MLLVANVGDLANLAVGAIGAIFKKSLNVDLSETI